MSDRQISVPAETAYQGSEDRTSSPGRSRFAVITALMAVGIVGGAHAWWAASELGQSFPLDPKVRPLLDKQTLTPEEELRLGRAEMDKTLKNTALSLGIFGAIVAAFIGGVEGVLRRRILAALTGVVVGVLAGGGFGVLGGLADASIYDRLQPEGIDPTYLAIMMHGAAFVLAGLGVGVAAAVGARQWSKIFVIAAAGLVAGSLFPIVAAVILPVPNADVPLPVEPELLGLWMLLPAGLMGLAAGRTSKRHPVSGPVEGRNEAQQPRPIRIRG